MTVLRFLLLSMLFLFMKTYCQKDKNYIIVKIEKKTNRGLHKYQTDYWIVDLDKIKTKYDEAIRPLYKSNLSATDYDECCIDNNLVLFNYTKNESFDYEKGILGSQRKLEIIVENHNIKAQSIKKTWYLEDFKIKEEINIFFTPITGEFCFCWVSHRSDDSKIGYKGKIGIPVSNINYIEDFNYTKYEFLNNYDFTDLPFLSLHTIQ